MATNESNMLTESQPGDESIEESLQNPELEEPDSDDSYDSDDYITDSDDDEATYTRPGEEPPVKDTNPETNIRRFTRLLESKRMKRMQEEEENEYEDQEDLFNFPKDREHWTEEDLQELWADAPLDMTKPGWDPVWADEEDWKVVDNEIKAGRDPGIQPFYVPYRKPYPAIPDNHYDISTPKAVVEELDRIEEFLIWVSYIFPDGSTYEGTVWDDLAHGKGVYVAENGLVRYEGEWLQNNAEGHGVVEVDIPDIEPVPGSKLEEKMRAEGRIIERDYMTPEDAKWLEMDVEDSLALTDGQFEVPFYERDEWVKQFGRKPEKGRYRYAGQWKHDRMHGCGVYEVNERTVYGRFYFGELLEGDYGCDEEVSALHAGLAEVAAAKARMFINKPDGMVREERGPYGDPQHPYFYEEEDVWMAPGFINQFYEVPDYWKTYVHEVDQEREMWLNSFYKAPLRLPMPAELEYWWQNEEVTPEFVLINKEPEPDPKNPSKLIYKEDPLILHTPSGRIIDYVEDKEHGIRLFWRPPLEDGGKFDPEKVQFLPLGFDEFYGREVSEENQHPVKKFATRIENALKPVFDKLEKWVEEKKKDSDMKMEIIKQELELIEAELSLEEAIEDLDEELKQREKEEEENVEMGLQDKEDIFVAKEERTFVSQEKEKEREEAEEEEEPEEEEDDEDDLPPSSFGSVVSDKDEKTNDQNGRKTGNSPFSASSLSFTSGNLFPAVQSRLHQAFLSWKQSRLPQKPTPSIINNASKLVSSFDSISFPLSHCQKSKLKAEKQETLLNHPRSFSNKKSQLNSLSHILVRESPSTLPRKNQRLPSKSMEEDLDRILSLQVLRTNHFSIYTGTSVPS